MPDLRLAPGSLLAGRHFPRLLRFYLALTAAEALLVFALLLRISAPSKRGVLFGYSPERLVTAGGMLLAGLFFAWLLVRSFRRPVLIASLARFLQARLDLLITLSALAFVSGWVMSLLPAYQYGRYQAYIERLYPVLAWLALFGFQTGLLLLLQRAGFDPGAAIRPGLRRAFLLSLAGVLLAWGLVAVTRVGITPDRNQWNDNGIPLLGLQILLATGFGLLLAGAGRGLRERIPDWALDGLVFAGLWGIAALLWTRAPMPEHFFAPGPYPPSDQPVPFSDAEFFDLGSQSLLAGVGYNGGKFYDRALYMGFLALLHGLVGQEYTAVAGLQAALFAVLPALIYLLGRALHSRAAGGMAAVLAICKELNNIAASRTILTAHSRLFLTEFPTLITLVLFTLLAVLWLRRGRHAARYALLSGAVLGFSTMLRSNPLFLLPVGWGISFLAYWRSWRRWLVVIALFMAGLTASISPWMVRNQQVAGRGFFYLTRIQDVIRARYQPDLKATATPDPARTPVPSGTTGPGMEEPAAQPPATSGGFAPVLRFISAHTAHNVIASVLELPLSPRYDSLEITLQTGFPWQADWQGNLPADALPLFLLNLGFLALGLGAAWSHQKWAGLVPLGVFLGYSLSNGFARASGGRYLVPMEWVVYLYFAVGVIQAAFWLARMFQARPVNTARVEENARPSLHRRVWAGLVGLTLAVLAFAALLPLSEGWQTLRYPAISAAELAEELRAGGLLEQAGITPAELEAFLQNPEAVLARGRALYPRYYAIDQGEPDRLSAYRAFPYPRLAFRLLLGRRNGVVLLPQNKPDAGLSSGADVIVLGCGGKGFTDAYAVFVGGDAGSVLMRQPAAALECPLKTPVCDNNRNCR